MRSPWDYRNADDLPEEANDVLWQWETGQVAVNDDVVGAM